MDKTKAEAIARARSQIAVRIAHLCKNLSPDEFDALLDRMAGIQCKYESGVFLTPAGKAPPKLERR